MKNIFLLLALFPLSAAAAAVRHEITARLDPARGTLAVTDILTFPAPAAEFTFTLHKDLNPAVTQPGAALERVSLPAPAKFDTNTSTSSAALESYRVKLPRPARAFTLSYGGMLTHPLSETAQEYARSFSETPGIISEKGCYLSGSSGWYPGFEGTLVTYRLETRLPAPYHSVSAGARASHKPQGPENVSVWVESKPQDDITLACGIYREYARPGRPALYAFLLSADDELAARYLEAAEKYSAFYSTLLGPYPYAKFALVENFWETGYGMPSFTLLGSKVIRLPFIINSSYPHEILHNWWGNGVFVDYIKGNWCEGLTAYLADYLIAENRGRDRDYRAETLRKYAAYVRDGKDFPLTDFRGRNSSASEAVGYGKALMFYHMLRGALGDEKFKAGLRAFYAANLFRAASFADLRTSFEGQTGPGRLAPFFDQWLRRTGAPELAIQKARVSRLYDEHNLDFTLVQRQDGPAYALKVPVLVYLEGMAEPRRRVLDFASKEETFNYSAPLKILRLEVDPEFDVFRRLSPLETPPGLAAVLGAKNPVIILPEGPGLPAWQTFTAAWAKDADNLPLVTQSTAMPASSFWVLGADNPLAPAFEARLETYGARFTTSSVLLDNREFSRAGHTFVFADYHPDNPASTSGLISSPSTAALAALALKLPHYGKYSWLVFDSAMVSAATGLWPAPHSPLAVNFTDTPPAAKAYAPRRPLAELPSLFSRIRLAADLKALAALPGGRGHGSDGLKAAAAYIEKSFSAAGLKPFQPAEGGLRNLTFKVKGLQTPGEYVFLTAHYDHLPADGPRSYPGADDNASGVALLLELARYYAAHPQPRTIVFAAFDGEERGRLGSRAFLAGFSTAALAGSNAALNFDTVGRLGAGKLLILGSSSSDKWAHIFRGAGFITGADYALVKEDLDSSDQVSFVEKGVPAVQFFSGPNADYHKPTDTADKADPAGLVKQAAFAKEIIDYLAGDSPFITRPEGAPSASPSSAGPRRVSTGLVPDFTYQGEGELAGVRAQDITPGSPLDLAGVKPGQVIAELNGRRVTTLKEYSEVLKTLDPGARIPVIVITPGLTAVKYKTEIVVK